MKDRVLWAALAVCAFLSGGPLSAAKVLDAPTRMAMTGLNQVMVMEVAERLDEDRLLCRRVVDVWGEPSDPEVVVRFFGAAASAQPGEHYLIVYTRYRRNPLVRDLRELDPQGARVVELAVVGRAIFADRPELRLLFGRRDDAAAKAEHLAAAMTLVTSGAEQERLFGIAEVGLGRDLRSRVGPEQVEVFQPILMDATVSDLERELLLSAAMSFPDGARGDWLTEVASGILQEGGDTQLELGSFRPALIERALEILTPAIGPANVALFARWLESNSPGVVKAAIGALDNFDTQLARRHALRILDEPDLDSPTHRVLMEYLRYAPQPWDEEPEDADGRP